MINAELPGLYFFAKNLQLRYSHYSQNLTELIEVGSISEVIGKIDSDLCWKKYARFYNSIDQEILKENIFYYDKIEPITLKNGPGKILISKYPLLNNQGNCIGVSGHFINITSHSLFPSNGYVDEPTGRFYFTLDSKLQYLTSREVSVLKLLMIGHRPKKIACLLKISKRTVDEHIDNIKIKLNCHITSEITPLAFSIGLQHLTFNAQTMNYLM